MKIVVPGRSPGCQEFTCPSCRCVFIADKHEYAVTSISVTYEGREPLWRNLECTCPTCGWQCKKMDRVFCKEAEQCAIDVT